MNILKFPKKSAAWAETKNNWIILMTGRMVIALTIASLICIIALWTRLPSMVPLWFSRPWGTDQLAHPLWLFILPISSILLYFMNLAISTFLTAEYLIFTQISSLTSLLVSFLSFVALVKILFLIT
jgi:hypothetical protein